MTADLRFEACLPFILKEEGGNDDDPHDHGGRTSRGITQREYNRDREKRGLSVRDVWTATDDEIRQIYYENYWLPRCPKLHAGVDLVYFNFAVNSGEGEAEKLLLRSIGRDDSVDDDAETIKRFAKNGIAFYQALAQFPRYGREWLRRTSRIEAEALKMAAAYTPHGPVVPSRQPTPPEPSPPIITQTEGHIIMDVTQVEQDVDAGLDAFEKVLPFLSMFVGPRIAAALVALDKGIRTVEPGVKTAAEAVLGVTNHLTPGKPNSPALNG